MYDRSISVRAGEKKTDKLLSWLNDKDRVCKHGTLKVFGEKVVNWFKDKSRLVSELNLANVLSAKLLIWLLKRLRILRDGALKTAKVRILFSDNNK